MIERIKSKIGQILSPYVIKKKKKQYKKKLNNDNFTILCSNCIGGVIYNRLDMQFLSPTINMWETQGDFIKFATNLEYYVNQPLEFIETDENCPVAKCGDIKLHFNHYKDDASAESSWNKRKERINYDNIYIIFYYRDNYSIDDLRQIEKAKCKNIALLTSTPVDLDYAVLLKESKSGIFKDSFLDHDIFDLRSFEKQWDFVSWLNSVRE